MNQAPAVVRARALADQDVEALLSWFCGLTPGQCGLLWDAAAVQAHTEEAPGRAVGGLALAGLTLLAMKAEERMAEP